MNFTGFASILSQVGHWPIKTGIHVSFEAYPKVADCPNLCI